MDKNKIRNYIENVLENMPTDWLQLTTHRLDIYNEDLAKTQFLNEFEKFYNQGISETTALSDLPTAYDYIRLGHPLSSILEWALAKLHHLEPENVISFQSQTMPLMAILRKNLLEKTSTRILYTDALPSPFDAEKLKSVYGYKFEIKKVDNLDDLPEFNGSTVLISEKITLTKTEFHPTIDFYIDLYGALGSIFMATDNNTKEYISETQHVRRRETVAMTPANCHTALKMFLDATAVPEDGGKSNPHKKLVQTEIQKISGSHGKALVATSGLSIQYAIMMGLIDEAMTNHPGKAIKFIVPPNCYGGTNDQARRIAACDQNIQIVDLLVDGENDMVQSIDKVLEEIAKEDAIPYIIAEIPTNPRVEVPDLEKLKAVLTEKRKTDTGKPAVDPVFILDQTFCPNVHFLGNGEILAEGRALSYASGSKFPSGGLCTAGYCIGNQNTDSLMHRIEIHLYLCDNEATPLQYEILAKQMPSMNQRIAEAYKNTREFVRFIHEVLPDAMINFVSEELANQGFTPSVFSLDLPTKGNTDKEREDYKRALNLKLIHLMITEIPDQCKFCVSYGQLKGSYWTIPATSTQGTTKEGDKDYIVRVSLSPNMDLDRHKEVFRKFVNSLD